MEEFVFNVIVSKLQIGNELDTNEPTSLTFEWGDDDKFKFQLNTGLFDEAHNIEFEQNIEELIEKLEMQPFKLRVTQKKEKYGEDITLNSEDREAVETTADEDIVGEAECSWPSALLEFLKNKECSTIPFTAQYDLNRNERTTGSVTLSIRLYPKCVLDQSKLDQSLPFVDKEGNLAVFKQTENLLNPNDVFFVIGDPPGPQPMSTNIFTACGGKESCCTYYDVGRYRNMKGTLVKDCSDLIDCGSLDCCPHKDDDKICEEVWKDLKAKSPPGACCMDPCERLFGPIGDSCEGVTCTDLELPCHSEFHTINCIVEQNRKHCRRKRDTLKNGTALKQKNNRMHTAPGPEFHSDKEKNLKRHCPICCEDISSIKVHGICPKCGFTPKLTLPLERMTYDETKTTKRIFDDLNEAAEKSQHERKVSKLVSCFCTPKQECVCCKIRRMSEIEGKKDNRSNTFRPIEHGKDSRDFFMNQESKKNEHTNKSEVLERIREVGDFIADALAEGPKILSSKQLPDEQMQDQKRLMQCCKMNTLLKTYDINKSESCFLSKISKDLARRNPSAYDRRKFSRSKPSRRSVPSICKQCCINQNTNKQQLEKRPPSQKIKYYNFDEYPGVILGHKYCLTTSRKVPRYMGWLWSASICGSRRGWRPGAVRRNTHKIMKFFQKMHFRDSEAQEKEHDKLGGGDGNRMPSRTGVEIPKIKVTKKNGQYHVTVYPMPNSTNLNDASSTPIEFTIDKDPVELTKRLIKTQLKEMGFAPCICGKPIKGCTCREKGDRASLRNTLQALCEEMHVLHLKDQLYFSDSTESRSELEMEFVTPTAFGRDKTFRKPKKVYASTQCTPEDIKVSHPREGVWKYDDQDFKLSQGCGGLSRLPPCRAHRSVNTKSTIQGAINVQNLPKANAIDIKVPSLAKPKTQAVSQTTSITEPRKPDKAKSPKRIAEPKPAKQIGGLKSKQTGKLSETKNLLDSRNSSKKPAERVETQKTPDPVTKSKPTPSSTNSPVQAIINSGTLDEGGAKRQTTPIIKNPKPVKLVKQTQVRATKLDNRSKQPPPSHRTPSSHQPTVEKNYSERQNRPATPKNATSEKTRQRKEPKKSNRSTSPSQKTPFLNAPKPQIRHMAKPRRPASTNRPTEEIPTILKNISTILKRPVKQEACQKASLMEVRFKAHSCQKIQPIRVACPTIAPQSIESSSIYI